MRTKYARPDPRNPDPKGDFAHRAMLEAEIDALREENVRLTMQILRLMEVFSTHQKEEECDK